MVLENIIWHNLASKFTVWHAITEYNVVIVVVGVNNKAYTTNDIFLLKLLTKYFYYDIIICPIGSDKEVQ